MSHSRGLPEPPHTDAPWGTCRWCGKGIAKPDGTQHMRRRWHEACLTEFLDHDPRRLRQKVFVRDKGVCAACGVNTEVMEARMKQERRSHGGYRSLTDTGLQLHLEGYKISQSLWEMDHVVALADGGGNGLDNLQTLCQPCHRGKTSRENSARAARRA